MRGIFKSLVARLVVTFVILSLIAAAVVSFAAYKQARITLVQSIYQALEHALSHKEEELNRWVNVARQDVILVAHSSEVRKWARALFKEPDDSLAHREAYLNLTEILGFHLARMQDLREIFILADSGGRIVKSTSLAREGDYRPTDGYYIGGRTSRFVQSIYLSPITGEPAITIAMPLLNEIGDRMGVMAAHVDLDAMDDVVLAGAGLGTTGEIYLVDRLNIFASSIRFGRQEFPRGVHTTAIDAAVRGEDGKGLYMNYNGIPVIGVYRNLDDLGLVLISEISQAEAFEPARRLGWNIVMVASGLAIMIIFGSFLLARRIARPILAITDASVKVSEGDLKAKAPILTRDEMGTLARTFNAMTEKLDSLYQALSQSEEHFRTIFQTSPDSITICRLEDGMYVNVSDGFVNLTGYTPEEVLGKTGKDISIWRDPSSRESFFSKLGGAGSVSNLEADFRKKDGTFFTALVSANLIDLKNEPHILSMKRDITRLKLYEKRLQSSLAEKEILLKEIHHRVKNNLQVISGLLDLQAHHIVEEESRVLYKESQNRVITMALIHEKLYQSKDLARVDFGVYLKNLTSNLFVSYGIDEKDVQLILEADAGEMVVDTAIPCGLIVNELITNSLKHAFPGNGKGEIRVGFKSLRDDGYLLTVSDNGVGLPEDLDIEKSQSLGLQLVTVLVEQLGGSIKFSSREGAAFSITFSEYLEAGSELL